jgi:hypothetical protein
MCARKNTVAHTFPPISSWVRNFHLPPTGLQHRGPTGLNCATSLLIAMPVPVGRRQLSEHFLRGSIGLDWIRHSVGNYNKHRSGHNAEEHAAQGETWCQKGCKYIPIFSQACTEFRILHDVGMHPEQYVPHCALTHAHDFFNFL